MSENKVWQKCLKELQTEISVSDFNIWITSLHAEKEGETLYLLAPNDQVRDQVQKKFLEKIKRLLKDQALEIVVQTGSRKTETKKESGKKTDKKDKKKIKGREVNNLNEKFIIHLHKTRPILPTCQKDMKVSLVQQLKHGP